MDPLEIKISRIRLGLTQHELGLRLGVPCYAVSRWETGYAKPSPTILARLQEIIQENGNAKTEARA